MVLTENSLLAQTIRQAMVLQVFLTCDLMTVLEIGELT